MINDINHLVLIGTLSEDAKLVETKRKEPMVILTIATSSEWAEDCQTKKRTLWNKVFFFGQAAVSRSDYKKGMVVQVTAEVGEKPIIENEKTTYKTMIIGKSSWVMDLGHANRPPPHVDDVEETAPF